MMVLIDQRERIHPAGVCITDRRPESGMIDG